MDTYLFTWNPKRWNWENIEDEIEQVNTNGKYEINWSCGNTKSIQPNDRFFLIRIGVEPKGIIGAGFTTTKPVVDRHWIDEDKEALYVKMNFDILLNPDKDSLLTLDILKTENLSKQNWTPQASGISIRPEIVDELEAIWFDFLTTSKIKQNPFVRKESEEQETYTEGTVNQVTATRYERNPFARQKCLEHYGYSCFACGFNFEEVYGNLGKAFIHVHHLTPVATVGKQDTNPIKDLRPVCPNCHAMIHRNKEALSIEMLQSVLRRKK
jgi:5-methylcytosine-specific restriction protein A